MEEIQNFLLTTKEGHNIRVGLHRLHLLYDKGMLGEVPIDHAAHLETLELAIRQRTQPSCQPCPRGGRHHEYVRTSSSLLTTLHKTKRVHNVVVIGWMDA